MATHVLVRDLNVVPVRPDERRAAAQVCREAGARVASNVMLRDRNLDVPLADARRIEVLANGLPLYQGAQVAVDTTLVSPVSRDGAAPGRFFFFFGFRRCAAEAPGHVPGAPGSSPLQVGSHRP